MKPINIAIALVCIILVLLVIFGRVEETPKQTCSKVCKVEGFDTYGIFKLPVAIMGRVSEEDVCLCFDENKVAHRAFSIFDIKE